VDGVEERYKYLVAMQGGGAKRGFEMEGLWRQCSMFVLRGKSSGNA
jgi:hypothetical protein